MFSKKNIKNKKNKNPKKTKKKNGGKAIDSGGFGCIFNPALKCKNKTNRTKGISKLSFLEDSNKEFNILKNVQKYLSKIPNYDKFFLIKDITKCTPDKLSISDKNQFDKCFSLTEHGITGSNINTKLQELSILNMPYGGVNLDVVVDKKLVTIKKYNSLLTTLLKKAIVPMNNQNIYHFDIKSMNILYKNNSVKIIDFGEIGISTSEEIIPYILFNRNIQYNSPFSRILFSNFINFTISKIFTENKVTPKTNNIKKFKLIGLAYEEYVKMYGFAHQIFIGEYLFPEIFKLIPSNLVKKLFGLSSDNLNYQIILSELIVNYLLEVINKYFDYKVMKLDVEKYFIEVYSKNVDIYGLISCYVPFIIDKKAIYPDNLKLKISNILFKYCYNSKYSIKVIEVDELISDLDKLN